MWFLEVRFRAGQRSEENGWGAGAGGTARQPPKQQLTAVRSALNNHMDSADKETRSPGGFI